MREDLLQATLLHRPWFIDQNTCTIGRTGSVFKCPSGEWTLELKQQVLELSCSET